MDLILHTETHKTQTLIYAHLQSREFFLNPIQRSTRELLAKRQRKTKQMQLMKVYLIGDGGVGKSAVLKRIMHDVFSEVGKPT